MSEPVKKPYTVGLLFASVELIKDRVLEYVTCLFRYSFLFSYFVLSFTNQVLLGYPCRTVNAWNLHANDEKVSKSVCLLPSPRETSGFRRLAPSLGKVYDRYCEFVISQV